MGKKINISNFVPKYKLPTIGEYYQHIVGLENKIVFFLSEMSEIYHCGEFSPIKIREKYERVLADYNTNKFKSFLDKKYITALGKVNVAINSIEDSEHDDDEERHVVYLQQISDTFVEGVLNSDKAKNFSEKLRTELNG